MMRNKDWGRCVGGIVGEGGGCRVERWDVFYVTSQAFSFHLGNKNIERERERERSCIVLAYFPIKSFLCNFSKSNFSIFFFFLDDLLLCTSRTINFKQHLRRQKKPKHFLSFR